MGLVVSVDRVNAVLPPTSMTTKREAFIIVAVAVTGVTVYLGLTWLLVFLMFDVFDISNPQADFKDLVIEVIPYVVPLTGAVLAAVLVAKKLRGKREDDQGFQVISQDRDGPVRHDPPPGA